MKTKLTILLGLLLISYFSYSGNSNETFISGKRGFLLYPDVNSSKARVYNISRQYNSLNSLQIFDKNGYFISSISIKSIGDGKINLSNLTQGEYIVQFEFRNEFYQQRLLIQ